MDSPEIRNSEENQPMTSETQGETGKFLQNRTEFAHDLNVSNNKPFFFPYFGWLQMTWIIFNNVHVWKLIHYF